MKRWAFLTAILIAIFFLSANSFGQGHFVLSYTGSGQDQMNINVVAANIGGVVLEAGDEIAAFDGTICCGKVILQKPIVISNSSTFKSIAASRKDDGLSNGYTAGNPITFKFWDSSLSKEISGITAVYIDLAGNVITAPNYTASGSVLVKLSVGANVNVAPIANAGINQTVNEGMSLTLDGSGSSDPNGSTLNYKWTAPAGIILSSTTVAKPIFTAPQVSVNTNYTFSLTVNDGTTNSVADEVIVTVTQVNQPTASKTLGNTDVFSSVSTAANRRAIPVTFSEAGEIQSISIYHNGGTGNVLLGVYSDQTGLPSSKLAVTAATVINAASGWQTVSLTSPLTVSSGQKVWLVWVFQNSVGVRYTAGTPGRAQSTGTWAGGMPASFGASAITGNKFSIYCTYAPGITTTATLGNTEVYGGTSTAANRRAIPVTFSEAGEIQSISIYHNGGTGNVMLGVYSDQTGLPSSKLGVTAATVIKTTAGWQTVSLTSPVSVTSGQKVWLVWVFQNSVGVRYTAGTPGRAQSTGTWAEGMPAAFGASATAGNKFSIYCTYTTNQLKSTITTLGIDLISHNSPEVLIYPNPIQGSFTVELKNFDEQKAIMTIYNILGSPVKKVQIEPGNNLLQVDIGNIQNGIYLVELRDLVNGKILHSSRLVKSE